MADCNSKQEVTTMNDENLAILIENIIRAVRSCAEPFFVPVTNETEYTEHAKRKLKF
jgi:histone H3/H4